jgi:ribose-phosphate pyrophosphokinase
MELNRYPDGTLLIKDNNCIFNNDVEITWHYESDNELFALMCLAKHFKNKCKTISLKMPYCPNSRMDRVKTDEDIFTLKYFAELINSLNFDNVYILDPHSYVSEALFNNLHVQVPKYFIEKSIIHSKSKNFIMFYPDEGAMKRYSGLASKPYAFGIKKRNWETGKIEGLDVAGSVDKIAGKDILIVDDICSRGGTFYHSAKKLKELGANKIYLYVTHCENTILEGDLLTSGLVEKVYTTNSIFTKEHEMIEVFEL